MLLAAAAVFAFGTTAHASPIGTTYGVGLNNFGGAPAVPPAVPGDPLSPVGGGVVTFDGIAEPIGSLLVNESATTLPDGGELLEFWISTQDGSLFTDPANIPSAADPSLIAFGPLTWAGGEDGITRANSSFFYFTRDGVPLIATDVLGLVGLPIGPHPFDPAIPSVVFFPNTPETPVVLGVDTGLLGTTYGTVEALLNIAAQGGANDFHIAIIVDHIVPEPASLLLLGMGLAGLALARRRA